MNCPKMVLCVWLPLLTFTSLARAMLMHDCGPQFRMHQLQMGQMKNFQYLLECDGRGLLVDAAWDIDALLRYAKDLNVEVQGGLYTHSHFDHIGGTHDGSSIHSAADLAQAVDGHRKLWIGNRELDAAAKQAGISAQSWAGVVDGDSVNVFGTAISIIAIDTPGHTSGGVSYFVRHASNSSCAGAVLTGDTLFAGSVGRSDLPGGSKDELLRSLARLSLLPRNTVVFPGHDYTSSPVSTIQGEAKVNSWMVHAVQQYGKTVPRLPPSVMLTFGALAATHSDENLAATKLEL